MSITVADILKLPSLREAVVAAGKSGLSRIVSSISVLEYTNPTMAQEELFQNIEFYGNEIVITAFANVKDNVEAQCANIHQLSHVGEVGLILYYVGVLLPQVDDNLVKLADQLEFPLIVMPKGRMDLRYSEVICEVMEAIFLDQQKNTSLVTEILERVSGLPSHQQTMDTVLKMLSDRLHVSLILTDASGRILNEACWPRIRFAGLQPLFPEILRQESGSDSSQDALPHLYRSEVHADQGMMHLFVFQEQKTLENNLLRQIVEVIKLSVSLWSRRHDEVATRELVRAILQDEPAKIYRLAEIFRIDIKSLHSMWVIQTPGKALQWANTDFITEIRQFLGPYTTSVLIDTYEDYLIIFMDGPQSLEDEDILCTGIFASLEARDIDGYMTCCNHLENTIDAREVYLMNKEYHKDTLRIFPEKQIFHTAEIQLARQCREIFRQGEAALARATTLLRPVSQREEEAELFKTLSVYLLDAQSSVARTAELLFVHKNTVKYRLKRCSQLLGFHIGHQPETMALYQAAALMRLLH